MGLVNVQQIARVQSCLAEASSLADLFAEKGFEFPDRVASWLRELESSAREAQLSIVPRVAGLRVSVEAARRGFSSGTSETSQDKGRMTRRKARHAAAQQALRSAIELTLEAVRPFEERQLRAQDIALTIVSRSFERALWPGQGKCTDMPSMWQTLLADPDLGSQVRELSALLGLGQGMILVARTMNEFANNGAQ